MIMRVIFDKEIAEKKTEKYKKYEKVAVLEIKSYFGEANIKKLVNAIIDMDYIESIDV